MSQPPPLEVPKDGWKSKRTKMSQDPQLYPPYDHAAARLVKMYRWIENYARLCLQKIKSAANHHVDTSVVPKKWPRACLFIAQGGLESSKTKHSLSLAP